MFFWNLVLKLFLGPGYIFNKLKIGALKRNFHYCGKNVNISKNFICSGEKNISIGEKTAIGPNCVFYASLAEINIGKYVMVSPNVTIITGEHRTDIIGEYMRNVKSNQKLAENDQPVIIEDDVWIGSNVTILKGTRIGRGSIIHAGCVVSGVIKPYTVYISNKIKISRFNKEEIIEHERIIAEKYGEKN